MEFMNYSTIRGEVKSPLRYPGGKTRAIKKIFPLIPRFKEFREPFVGGGSVFIALKQRVSSDTVFKINDLNRDLYCFWKIARDENEELVRVIREIKEKEKNGRKLKEYYNKNPGKTDFERAVRFFVINRISFSKIL